MSPAASGPSHRSHPARPSRRSNWRATLYSSLTAFSLAASVLAVGHVADAAAPPNLVRNKGFEVSLHNWEGAGLAMPRLSRIHPGRSMTPGTAAARITATTTGRARLNDIPNTVPNAVRGAVYRATAWVRTMTPTMAVRIRIREKSHGTVVGRSVADAQLAGTTWRQVSVTYTVRTTGTRLDLNLMVLQLPKGSSFDVDRVTLQKLSGPTASGPNPATRTSSRKCKVNSNLVPSCGVLWGAYIKPGAVKGAATWQTAYTRMESRVGRKFDIVKRYHDFSNAGSSGAFPDAAERSLATGGRIPHFAWVSKNYSTGAVAKWADIAAGNYDAKVVDPVARRLKAYGGKVFLDFDHEMDGATRTRNGTPASYAAAYRHIHARFAAIGATNVVWVWVPTGYLGNVSKIAASYPGDAYVDWIGYDPYNFASCHSTTWRGYGDVISGFYNWLMAHGHGNKPFMLAEYGSVAGSDANARAKWFRGQVTALKRHPNIKAIQLFNSSDGGSCNAEISADAPALDAWGDMGRNAYFSVAH
jgi:hypothetical protein